MPNHPAVLDENFSFSSNFTLDAHRQTNVLGKCCSTRCSHDHVPAPPWPCYGPDSYTDAHALKYSLYWTHFSPSWHSTGSRWCLPPHCSPSNAGHLSQTQDTPDDPLPPMETHTRLFLVLVSHEGRHDKCTQTCCRYQNTTPVRTSRLIRTITQAGTILPIGLRAFVSKLARPIIWASEHTLCVICVRRRLLANHGVDGDCGTEICRCWLLTACWSSIVGASTLSVEGNTFSSVYRKK